MTRAPAEAGAAWTTILGSVASSFTAPSHVLFVALVSGWVLTPGRRTITHIITTIDPRSRRPHDAYHRLVRDGTWDMVRLWRTLATVMVDRLVGAEAVVLIDIDDTLFHKSGRRVDGAGLFRDAVRSTRNRVVHALGLNVVVATLRVRPPWPGTPIALPVAARIRRKDDGPSTVDLARAILFDLSVWLPDRQIEVACDGAYSNLCVDRPERVHVTSRIRRNAATYELTPPRTGRRGRPRKKGDRLPPLATMADTASFTHRQIDVRGTTATRLVWSRTLLWYGVTRDTPVLLVVVGDPDGIQPDDFFVTTNTAACPAWIAGHYAGRWSIEVTFRDTKQSLGGHQPQSWKRRGPERTVALSLWLHAAIWLWYLDVWGDRPSWTTTPWHPAKTSPSFVDALAALRTVLWTQRISPTHPAQPLTADIRDQLVAVLARAG